eukprot:TRINITY_DN28873_c0_g1_i1.p1 TRINITY_DN28873_c0_g1~~TRINITY_DN28873_c0_g1_i1.p1  ORF type:complete len:187 (+),score=25.75 TRINITY_DN28873_c0_g1_i1:222-782(+)
MKYCPICLMEYDLEKDIILLECGHLICKYCLKHYLETKIKEHQVTEEELICPLQDCRTTISDVVIINLISNSYYEKMVRVRLRSLEGKNEFYKYCPDCDIGEIIPKSAKVFVCPKCKKEICPKCNLPPHSGRCKDKDDLSKVKGIVRCPKCKIYIEKKSGCNFMTCSSPICKGKKKKKKKKKSTLR